MWEALASSQFNQYVSYKSDHEVIDKSSLDFYPLWFLQYENVAIRI